MFDIEDNIPVARIESGRRRVYPFDKLGVGQSFFVPCEGEKGNRTKGSVRSAARVAAKRRRDNGEAVKFVSRLETKDGVSGVRIHRVE